MRPYNRISNPEATSHLIIVMGVSGSGKSTLAETLATHYGYTYLDADNFHSTEARNLMAQHIPLTDEQRAPWVAALKQHLESSAANNANLTLAFSGLKKKHRDQLRNAGLRTIFLFLSGTKDIIRERVNNRQGHFVSSQLLESQFSSLENPLNESDVHAIDVSSSLEQVNTQAMTIIDEELLGK
jgi:gluconokinase